MPQECGKEVIMIIRFLFTLRDLLRLFLVGTLVFLFPTFPTSMAQDTKSQFSAESNTLDPTRPGYEMILSAKLVAKGQTIERGLVWRVFNETEGSDGKLPLIATSKGGTASFTLNAGTYLVHATFGRAGASKRVVLSNGGSNSSLVLQAGGLELTAVTGSYSIPAKDLRFSIYELEQDDKGERKLIAFNVAAEKVIQLNAGIYHVVSSYGTINATVRADLEVKAGEVTKAILQQRGSSVSLRLVSQVGGSPVANTAWTVFTKDGEKVFESHTVSPSLILAEGTYEAAVRNGENSYKKIFLITPGQNARVEILLN